MVSRRCWPLLLLVALLMGVTWARQSRDFYKILGVDRHADVNEIKSAYRKKAIEFHPDKTRGDEEATQRFHDVTAAHETLSDETKRRRYDQFGETEGGDAEQPQNPLELLKKGSFFGGGQHGHSAQERRGPDRIVDVSVNLQDMYAGADIHLSVRKHHVCSKCHGTGADDPTDVRDCGECGGVGQVMRIQQLNFGMITQMQMPCPKCGGKGKIIKTTCKKCRGAKMEVVDDRMNVIIAPGTPEGHAIVEEDEGDQDPDWVPGDLIFRVTSVPHRVFTRRGNNLYMRKSITLKEALLGFTKEVLHLDKQPVTMGRKDMVTVPGHVQRIANKGMPILHTHDFGDLFVEYHVVFPVSIPPSAHQELDRLLPSAPSEEKSSHDEL